MLIYGKFGTQAYIWFSALQIMMNEYACSPFLPVPSSLLWLMKHRSESNYHLVEMNECTYISS